MRLVVAFGRKVSWRVSSFYFAVAKAIEENGFLSWSAGKTRVLVIRILKLAKQIGVCMKDIQFDQLHDCGED